MRAIVNDVYALDTINHSGYVGDTWQAIVGYNRLVNGEWMFFPCNWDIVFCSKDDLTRWMDHVSLKWVCDKVANETKGGDRICIAVYMDHFDGYGSDWLEDVWYIRRDGKWVEA